MKLEREKQNSSKQTQVNKKQNLPKGILKVTPSYRPLSNTREKDKEFPKTENRHEKKKKKKKRKKNEQENEKNQGYLSESEVGFKRKRDVEILGTALEASQSRGESLIKQTEEKIDQQKSVLNNATVETTSRGDTNIMKEFEELLNYSDENCDEGEKETRIVTENTKNNDPKASLQKEQVQPKKKDKKKDLSTIDEEYENEIEQVAYEARIARLILMRPQQKRKRLHSAGHINNNEDGGDSTISIDGNISPLNYVPALAFQDNSKSTIHNNKSKKRDLTENSFKINEGEVKNSSSNSLSLSRILKEKRAKGKKMMDIYSENMDDIEDDAYWK